MEGNEDVPTKFNVATHKYEPDMEKINEKVNELNKSENKKEEPIKQEDIISKKESKKGEGSFRPILIAMLVAFLIAGFWDKISFIKNSINFVLNPTAGALLKWNLNIGMIIIVLIITIIITIVQKYATDQKTLKELKKEQKEIQKQMKEFKQHPEKMKELQKKQFAMMPKQMKLSMRGAAYTIIPFALFFQWFRAFFSSIGDPKFILGLSWFWFYLIFAMIIGSIIRKKMDVV